MEAEQNVEQVMDRLDTMRQPKEEMDELKQEVAELGSSVAVVTRALGNRTKLPPRGSRVARNRPGAIAANTLQEHLEQLVLNGDNEAKEVQRIIAHSQQERQQLARAIAATNAQADELEHALECL